MAQTPGPGGWTMPVETGPPEFLPILDIPEPGRQRRLTVFFRWLLLVPQAIVLWVLSVVAFFAVVIGWFAALVTARLPGPIARYLIDYLGYDTRVIASGSLLIDHYPPFSLRQRPDFPVLVQVRPGHLNRAAVFFRLILLIPAAIVSSLLGTGWFVLCFFIWLWVLIAGRMPRPVFEATAAYLRYRMRFYAYVLMLTSAYPKGLFGEEPLPGGESPASATRPLVLSTLGKVLLAAFLVLGLAGHITADNADIDNGSNNTINTAPAR
jgi:hypothetical protein